MVKFEIGTATTYFLDSFPDVIQYTPFPFKNNIQGTLHGKESMLCSKELGSTNSLHFLEAMVKVVGIPVLAAY